VAEKTDLVKAADALRAAMEELVAPKEHENIHVFESVPGHLRVVVGSDSFKGVGITERQERVWKQLKKKVEPGDLQYCWGVHPMDLDEYYAEHFPQGSSSSAYPDIGE